MYHCGASLNSMWSGCALLDGTHNSQSTRISEPLNPLQDAECATAVQIKGHGAFGLPCVYVAMLAGVLERKKNPEVMHDVLCKWTWLVSLYCVLKYFQHTCCELLLLHSGYSVLLKSMNKLLWLMIIAVKCLFLLTSSCQALTISLTIYIEREREILKKMNFPFKSHFNFSSCSSCLVLL